MLSLRVVWAQIELGELVEADTLLDGTEKSALETKDRQLTVCMEFLPTANLKNPLFFEERHECIQCFHSVHEGFSARLRRFTRSCSLEDKL